MRFGNPVAIALALTLGAAAPAAAAPPANDDRGNARAVTVPSSVNGTTREATQQDNEPTSRCAFSDNSVWYSLDARSTQRVAIELTARGDLDAVIDVYRRDRSQLEGIDCDRTDRSGDAAVRFTAREGERYLIRVAEQAGSESGDFTLELFSPEPEASPPGRKLPRRGATDSVDRSRDPSDAWWKRLRRGTSYVVTVASRSSGCPTVTVYEPGISSFDGADPLDFARCNQHDLFTPARTGRYSFLIRPGRGAEGAQRYRLRVRRASRDDTAPGNTIRNYERVRGHVGPNRADVVDLHRFHVNRRSDVTLRFSSAGPVTVEIRTIRGRLLARSGGNLRTQLRRGRFYAVVRSGDSGGKYTLQPAIREITRASIAINGRRDSVISPGQTARVGVAVTPRARGRVTIVVERLDPLEGWQFHARYRLRTATGHASATFVPRRPGRFRARAVYSGGRLSAPSETGYAYVSARERF